VLLLRQAGIPARYVVGYSAQEFSALEKAFLVRNRHAHAWAVALVDGHWVTVDTTPATWAEQEAEARALAVRRALRRVLVGVGRGAALLGRDQRWRDGRRRGRLPLFSRSGHGCSGAFQDGGAPRPGSWRSIACESNGWSSKRARAPPAMRALRGRRPTMDGPAHPRGASAPWRMPLAELAADYYRCVFDPECPADLPERFIARARAWSAAWSTIAAMTPDYWPVAKTHLAKKDRVLRKLIKAYPDAEIQSRGDAFQTLARAIVGQQISVKAAQSVWSGLPKPRATVDPRRSVRMETETLRACGFSGAEGDLREGPRAPFPEGLVRPRRWKRMDDEAVIEDLVRVKGIGPAGARRCFLMFHMLRPDVLPVDDLGLRRAMERQYNGGDELTRDEMRAIGAPWAPWRSVATWYLWRSPRACVRRLELPRACLLAACLALVGIARGEALAVRYTEAWCTASSRCARSTARSSPAGT
jgi:DNA-3-methyladenine glycosylase II